jgi:NADH:ubiquinone oxidoreductase subunit K
MFLLVLTVAVTAVGIGLIVEMYRRDEPLLGVVSLCVLTGAGVLGSTYGMLASL